MNALIISCGSGQGLRPITCSCDELTIKIMGKSVLGYMAENLVKHGFDSVGIFSSVNADEIQDYIDDCCLQSAQMYSITGSSAFSVVKDFAKKQTEPFAVICAPCVFDVDLSKVILYHKSIKADVTVVCSVVEETDKYNIVNLTRNGEVNSLFERPDWSHTSSNLANTGIYILNPEIIDIFNGAEHFDFLNDFLKYILKSGKKMYGYQTENYWHHLKDHSDLKKIIRDIMQHKVNAELPSSKNGIFYTDIIPEGEYDIIPPVYFGRNVRIGHNCTIGPFTMLDDNVTTGDSSRIKRSYVMRNSLIGSNCDVSGAIIGRNCVLKRNSAYLEGACLGDGCVVESGSTISNNVYVWPEKKISYRSVLTNNLREGRNEFDLISSDCIEGNTFTEISSERCCRVGEALGSSSCGGRVAVGYGSSKESKALAMALFSGLISSGSRIFDFGEAFESQMHFFVSYCSLDSGVFIEADKNNARIKFFGKHGLPLSCKEEREIEIRYKRCDFRRAHGDKLNDIHDMSAVSDIYYGCILSFAGDGLYGLSANVTSNNNLIKYSADRCMELLGVKSAPLPEFNIDSSGKYVTAKDERGRFVAYEQLLIAACINSFRCGNNVCVPFEAPASLEKFAEKYNCTVVRTGSFSSESFSEKTGTLSKQCMWAYDALSLVSGIIGIMKSENSGLSDIVDSLPVCNIYSKVISCNLPHSRIAEILDISIDTNSQGVRKPVENGYITILRQGAGRHLRIVAQGDTMEAAKEICFNAERKINIDTIDNMTQ